MGNNSAALNVRQRRAIDPALLTPDVMARFWPKVTAAEDGCLVWVGAPSSSGYGQFWMHNDTWPAHRVAWVYANGSVSPDLVLDHLCRNRACVNPEHLELVTQRENIRRGEAASSETVRASESEGRCARGHDLSLPGAWYHSKRGDRFCYACQREKVREATRRRSEARKAARESRPVVTEAERKAAKAGRAVADKVARMSRPIPDHVHGSTNGYGNYNCRCAPCVEANRVATAARRARRMANR